MMIMPETLSTMSHGRTMVPEIAAHSSSADKTSSSRGRGCQQWSVHECLVCVREGLPVRGGSDRGEFAYFGGDPGARVSYVGGGARRLEEGDVLLEIQGQKVAGFTQRDVVAWLNHCCKSGNPVSVCVARGGSLGRDLRQHLNTRFPRHSPDWDLQNTVRDNLYLRTVPCTTRAPRDGEVNGVDYTFLSVEDFMTLERSGNLLESGIYEGNHYGTPKPLEDCGPPASRPTGSNSGGTLPGVHPSSEGKRRRNRSSVEAMTASSGEREGDSGKTDNINSSQGRSEEGERELPENWEKAFTEDGEPYFIDHNTGTSQWLDPRPKNKKAVAECEEDELPYGWEKIEDPHYGTYYIDHVNKRTQYENPVAQARKISTSSLNEDSAKNLFQGQWRNPNLPPEHPSGGPPAEQQEGGRQRSASGPPAKEDGRPPCTGLRGPGYHPPYVFTDDPCQLEGTMVSTSLTKSPRGFGFTIVGGDDGEVREFLQVKAITPHGPAWQDGKLAVGDVLVRINEQCVLGFSHQEVVSLFQSIPPGEEVGVGVCRGYSLPFDPEDPANEIVLTNGVTPLDHGGGAESVRSSAKSMPDLTTAFRLQQVDLLCVEIVKGKAGFGFTIADSVYGQKVKKILDHERCHPLQEGDVLSEINGGDVRGLPHASVVQLLKDCPCDHPARIAVRRGLLPPRAHHPNKMKSSDDLGVRRSASNNSSHSYPYRSTNDVASMFRSKTPTADLYSSREKESLPPARPKTPLVDTRHQQDRPTARPESASEGHERPAAWKVDRPESLRAAYCPTLDKTTANPSWYTTLGKLRDTYWATDHLPRDPNKSADFIGEEGRPSDAPDHPQPLQPKGPPPHPRTNFNDSYEDSVFLSNSSWSGRENGTDWNPPDFSRGGVIPPNDTSSYGRTSSIRSYGPYYGDPMYRTSSTRGGGTLYDNGLQCSNDNNNQPAYRAHSTGAPSFDDSLQHDAPYRGNYDSLQRRRRGTSFEHEVPSAVYSGSTHPQQSGGPEYVDMTVTLQRQESGFGFRIVGGTEEGSQVAIGHLVPGGAAELDGRVRTGDEIVSVEGQSVMGTSHHRVVQLIGGTPAGRVTLGLRRRAAAPHPTADSRSLVDGGVSYPYEVTIMRQENEGFGFVIISSVSRAGATIGRIIEGSPADRSGHLHVGDRILRVNGASILDLHHGETVNLIKDSGHAITLTIGQPATVPEEVGNLHPLQYHAVQLQRGARGFGFSIRGGREFQCMPLFVLRIAGDGPAHTDGKLAVGDQIIEINGKNTKSMTHAQAIELIRQGNDSVRLLVRRGLLPPPGHQEMGRLDSDPFHEAMTQADDSSPYKMENLPSPLGRFHPHTVTSNGGSRSTSDSQDYYAWNYEQQH